MPGTSECESYSLVQLRNGAHSVRSEAYGETMHPGVGPEEEAETLYVRQTGLVERLRRHTGEFVVWDIGLGAAANALSVLHHTRTIPAHLRVLSFDCTDRPLRFALEHPDELPFLSGYSAVLTELLQARQASLTQARQQVDWQLVIGDFPALIQSPAAEAWPKPHLILFDPFSPAKNPAMWTLPLFERLYRLLDPNRPVMMPTYSRSTMQRVTMLVAGFYVGAGQATGRKEETTLASNDASMVEHLLDRRWLERAGRSDSAEPLNSPLHRKAPLTAGTRERLERHPQWKLAGGR